MTMTPYEILGIKPKASPAEITEAYRTLAQIYHPDRWAGAPENVRREADTRMKELNEAYELARKGQGHVPIEEARKRQVEAVKREQAIKTQVPWAEAARDRAQRAIRAEQERAEREKSFRHGQAVVRRKPPRNARPSRSILTGLGEALVTNKVKCRGCQSIQLLPGGWKERLDDDDFFCCFCERLLISRNL